MKGIVKNANADKGFGFIRSAGGIEYFFHRSAYTGFWNELCDLVPTTEVEVEFDLGESPKGPRAENVRRINQTS